ncbi:hypothetical protein N7448_004153 [Penicillium atrosanguineum]|uniref:Cupin type-2 domain-containing protein n=1 Tax=Penicillium atrosanguineum TaxID=1132637 RepID=A0A9W9L8B8_9EURO|nr:uncharacterized protein N7443_003118 [Penicillium atrosanguineum]KAJ5117211.1 hypothetical protein N7526_011320 [Penicillium atrosanguineum]KAJ5140745.1 hypothetical protein N7448_004153 [Penicillium atrosanguineum]KAJ5310657.1 hypothetical protein N7443_003118 [Penicillium atrosanguineum]KAJ5316180.1 hypothetical protein N7476_006487 [Penicillium atrosanguineum]
MSKDCRSSLRPLSRYITTHDATGKSHICDNIPDKAPVRLIRGGEMEFSLMYITPTFPVAMANDQDIIAYQGYLANAPGITIPGGTVCRTVDFPPGYTSPMHRTKSCDFGIVIEGEVELVLDSETKVLRRGDVAVQRGTNHAWHNKSKVNWARMLYVLQAANSIVIGGQELKEDQGGIH